MLFGPELRKKMLAAVERGESVSSVAARFEVTRRGLEKLIRRCEERGTIEPLRPGPKKPTKLTPADDAKMGTLIEADPGITLKAIIPHLSVEVVESTVYRRLQKLGYSLKKSH